VNRRILLTALIVLVSAMSGAQPANAAPGGGGEGDQSYDPCPPRTRFETPYKDSDGDGLSDCAEVNIFGTHKFIENTDWDQLLDGEEVFVYGTDPLNYDTDGDGDTDGHEVKTYFTDPLTPDPDSDGGWYSDGAEITLGMDPANPDTDGDGLLDGPDTQCPGFGGLKGYTKYGKALSTDFDGDGLGDYYEKTVTTTSGCKADTDSDGFSDPEEIQAGTNPKDAGSFP
jgi:hypothetical protein